MVVPPYVFAPLSVSVPAPPLVNVVPVMAPVTDASPVFVTESEPDKPIALALKVFVMTVS